MVWVKFMYMINCYRKPEKEKTWKSDKFLHKS